MTGWKRWLVTLAILTSLSGILRGGEPNEPATEPAKKTALAVSGERVAALENYDRMMESLLEKWRIPGGAIAVMRDGRLVFARGYGLADREAKKPVEPQSLFRIASVSKPITAVAVLKLVEQGKIKLDEPALAAIGPLDGPAGAKEDPRWKTINVAQLLHHTGGWDRDKSFDAMFIPEKAARETGSPAPADARTVIRYMRGQPLDFNPGERYAYSNLGYAILGRLIERRTGLTYGEAIEQLVLAPAGITRMRLGRTLPQFRAADEVKYYDANESDRADPVFPYLKDKVAWPDGGFYLEAMDAHGGWTASVVDLLRFVAAIEGRGPQREGKAILSTSSLQAMLAPPEPNFWKEPGQHYAKGWQVRRAGDDANWWHTGSLPGTSALLVRAHNGLAWAVLFNSRPEKYGKFHGEVDAACWDAATAVKAWPDHDLFSRYR